MKSLLIIPAYNEADNIMGLLQEISANYPQYDYIVINDCSTDQTPNILSSMNANYINLPVNLGIGGSVQTGYQYALEYDYEIAIQIGGLIWTLCGVKVLDVTSGMRTANRKMIEFFAKNYAQDYPEPEAILSSGMNGARSCWRIL